MRKCDWTDFCMLWCFLVAGMGKQHEEKEIIYITGGHGCFPYRFSFIDIPDVLCAYSDYK
ncbi:hypothetical protein MRY16398_31640 [Phytobacter sp. MRY16-398]|nr:hypothetical protein MRY16398_31640 [Phytobacter sp. MRY16-398]